VPCRASAKTELAMRAQRNRTMPVQQETMLEQAAFGAGESNVKMTFRNEMQGISHFPIVLIRQ
jgi:hypothetical protein